MAGLIGHMASVVITLICYCSREATVGIMKINEIAVV